jgi:hypothetical protein
MSKKEAKVMAEKTGARRTQQEFLSHTLSVESSKGSDAECLLPLAWPEEMASATK